MEQGTLFPEPPREQQLELGLDVPEKTPEDGTSAHSKSAEDMFLEDVLEVLIGKKGTKMFQTIKDIIKTIKHRDRLWLAAGFVDVTLKAVKTNSTKGKKGPHYLYSKIGKKVVELKEYYEMYC